jgi:hypothetical protein
MHKNATKCNETLRKWCKNKHGASKIIDTFDTYQRAGGKGRTWRRWGGSAAMGYGFWRCRQGGGGTSVRL